MRSKEWSIERTTHITLGDANATLSPTMGAVRAGFVRYPCSPVPASRPDNQTPPWRGKRWQTWVPRANGNSFPTPYAQIGGDF